MEKNDGKIYQSDIRLKSPYNTRIYKGLPPGPVGNPGLSSLQAALNPADTRYIYYVRDPDFNNGKHNFYVTPADFEKGVKKLREWEEKQRKAGLR
ncbi:MAG: endolytic transglycosylase MltG [Cyanobacteriota/Melainabacteria group bacterium]